jgi:lipopolysaccharide export system protein LptC
MIRRLITRFSLLLLVLLGVGTFWLGKTTVVPEAVQEADRQTDPDYVIENFSVIRTEADGIVRHRLTAKRMVHYPDEDTTQLQQPYFVDIEPGKPVMRVHAEEGRLFNKNEEMHLIGNVRVYREATRNRQATTVETPFLHIIPASDMASTNSPVMITEGKMVVRAVGMELNDNTGITRLLSKVRVTHGSIR